MEAKLPSHWTLLIIIIILGLILLITMLAFTAALLRMRKKHGSCDAWGRARVGSCLRSLCIEGDITSWPFVTVVFAVFHAAGALPWLQYRSSELVII